MMNIKNSLTYKYIKQYSSRVERDNPARQISQICLGITFRCNARCIMCDTWKKSSEYDFTLEELENFLSHSSLPCIQYFSLQGGEPFLREDIVQIVEIIHRCHPNCYFFIVTNCIATDTIVKRIKEIMQIASTTLCISIDGIDENTVDEIRGRGAYKNIMKTIDEVIKIPALNLIWSFTIQPLNYNQILDVYEFAKEKGFISKNLNQSISFCARPVSSGAYFNNDTCEPLPLNKYQKEKAISQLKEISKDMGGNIWLDYVTYFMEKEKKPILCGAGKYSCIITADLKVYPCSHCLESWSYGNLRDCHYSLQSLLNTPKARDITNAIKRCQRCANEIEGFSTLGNLWRRSLFKSLTTDLGTLLRKLSQKHV